MIAAKAVALKEAMTEEFKNYQMQILKNAKALSSRLIERGFRLVSGGTDNHLMLVDLRNKGITGRDAEKRLDSLNITCNKNAIPFDTQSPMVTSGIRLGTPAVTTRGFKEEDMVEVADIIHDALTNSDSDENILQRVKALCEKYPLYSEFKE